MFGLASDVGMPDGLNLGLALSPWDWMRLGASLGTNSAALGYRGGLTLVPLGWGPSFSFEAGHYSTADTTATLRYFFSVPSWVRPYVQQIGYTYLNAQVGFDWTFHNLTLFVHGGYTYLRGTVRAPNPVPIVDNLATPPATTTITIAQDGSVNAYSLSVKLGIVYLFGGD